MFGPWLDQHRARTALPCASHFQHAVRHRRSTPRRRAKDVAQNSLLVGGVGAEIIAAFATGFEAASVDHQTPRLEKIGQPRTVGKPPESPASGARRRSPLIFSALS